MLYRAFDFLKADDLRNLSVVCKQISSATMRYFQAHYTWDIEDSKNVETPLFARIRDALVSFTAASRLNSIYSK